MNHGFTRGFGVLEKFLAGQRAKIADQAIPSALRDGKILDLGCGFYPYFLSSIRFRDKFGINNDFANDQINGLTLIKHDFNADTALPFIDGFFKVVTMLAVAEHLKPAVATAIFKEANRVLAPNGRLIITVPWGLADSFLRFLSKIKFLSAIEINEHQQFYDELLIKKQLLSSGFLTDKIITKRFELGLNLLVIAKK